MCKCVLNHDTNDNTFPITQPNDTVQFWVFFSPWKCSFHTAHFILNFSFFLSIIFPVPLPHRYNPFFWFSISSLLPREDRDPCFFPLVAPIICLSDTRCFTCPFFSLSFSRLSSSNKQLIVADTQSQDLSVGASSTRLKHKVLKQKSL